MMQMQRHGVISLLAMLVLCVGGVAACGDDDGGGAPSCKGTPDPCSTYVDDLECIGQFGCDWTDRCSGVAESCYSQYSEYDCLRLDGCDWSNGSCSGSSTACSLLAPWQCDLQAGCYQDGYCGGTPWDCSMLDSDPYECGQHDGCEWR